MVGGDPDDCADRSNLAFDANGPALNGTRLVRRRRKGWVPVERELLEPQLLVYASLAGAGAFIKRLDAVYRAMDLGDFATAAIAAEHAVQDLKRSDRAQRLSKARPDDPRHPGWPAGAPDGKGGQFRPKEDAVVEGSDARLRRLLARKGLRSALRRILSLKRAARLAAELLGDAIPGLDVISEAATLADAMQLVEELAADAAETDAAIAFVEKGPQALEDLQVSSKAQEFSSYSAFQKVDVGKRFGPAGEGYEYHHIVEQGAVGPDGIPFTAQQVNSTTNIVRIPKLLHEDVTSIYASRVREGADITLRASLRGKSFAEQTKAGLEVLSGAGITP